MPKFRVVTVEPVVYEEGSNAVGVFRDMESTDQPTPILRSYSHEGDYVVLTYSGGLELSIPEHRIKYIAEQTA